MENLEWAELDGRDELSAGNAADGLILKVLPDIPLCYAEEPFSRRCVFVVGNELALFYFSPKIRKWEEQKEIAASKTCSM